MPRERKREMSCAKHKLLGVDAQPMTLDAQLRFSATKWLNAGLFVIEAPATGRKGAGKVGRGRGSWVGGSCGAPCTREWTLSKEVDLS